MGISVDIHKKLGDFTLDIAFRSDARRIGILGASGCGKSLTLKSIAGIERPDRGHIELTGAAETNAVGAGAVGITDAETSAAGANVTETSATGPSSIEAGAAETSAAGSRICAGGRVLFDSDSRINLKPQKRRVGYMFQNYALFPTMTVADNIAAGLRLPLRQRQERILEMIDRFRLQGLENRLPGQLSGGQQQRVALARIMACQPDLILLDEPFSALDQHLKERLQHEMMTLLEDCDSQVVMVSHSRDELYRFSEDLLIMENGSLLAAGKTRQLFDDPGTAAVARMTGCKNFSGAVRLDAHHLQLTDWDTELTLHRVIPEDTTAIGYRAHFFHPIWGERQDNCIPFLLSGVDELPFERRYYLFPSYPANAGQFFASKTPEETVVRGEPTGQFSASKTPGEKTLGGESADSAAAPPGGPKHTVDSVRSDEPPELICWFVQDSERRLLDTRPSPDYLQLREDAVMLLHG